MSAPVRHARGRRRWGFGGLAVLGALALATSCGVREDDSPRALAPDSLPAELSEATPASTIPGDSTSFQRVFMVETGPGGEDALLSLLLPIERPANEEERRRAVIEALVSNRPGEDDLYFNAIPATTGVLDVRLVEDNVLEINLSQLDVASGNLKLAIAQMVFTATELPGVDGVRFLLNREERAVPLEVGESEVGQVVTRDDFPLLNPTRTTTTTTTTTTVDAAEPVPAEIGEAQVEADGASGPDTDG
jgi:hypothetical protein